MRITMYLNFDVPDEEDADEGLRAEVAADAEPHDLTWRSKVERWLGGYLAPIEDIARDLPDDCGVRVDAERR